MSKKKRRTAKGRRSSRYKRRIYGRESNPAYGPFRKRIKERDDYECQWPGCASKKRLEVHHIKTWSKYPSLRLEMSNGITLCKICHARIKGQEESYEEFFIKLLEWQMLNRIKRFEEDNNDE